MYAYLRHGFECVFVPKYDMKSFASAVTKFVVKLQTVNAAVWMQYNVIHHGWNIVAFNCRKTSL